MRRTTLPRYTGPHPRRYRRQTRKTEPLVIHELQPRVSRAQYSDLLHAYPLSPNFVALLPSWKGLVHSSTAKFVFPKSLARDHHLPSIISGIFGKASQQSLTPSDEGLSSIDGHKRAQFFPVHLTRRCLSVPLSSFNEAPGGGTASGVGVYALENPPLRLVLLR